MQLIGIVTGNYEGNNWAKLVLTEDINSNRGIGKNAVVSKASYKYIMAEVMPNFELFENQEVSVSYDRFGKVQEVHLV